MFDEIYQKLDGILTHNGIQVIKKERKPGRAVGYDSGNFYVSGLMNHKILGSLPIKIQLRFRNGFKHEAVMRANYKYLGGWGYPPWMPVEEMLKIEDRSFIYIRQKIFENFKEMTKSFEAPEFNPGEGIIPPQGKTSFIQRFVKLQGVVRNITDYQQPFHFAHLYARTGTFSRNFLGILQEIGISPEEGTSYNDILTAPGEIEAGHVKSVDALSDPQARIHAGLNDNSQDMVFIHHLVNVDQLKPAMQVLAPNGVLFVSFALTDIQTDYRSIVTVAKKTVRDISKEDQEYEYILLGNNGEVAMPDDFPTSLDDRDFVPFIESHNKILKVLKVKRDAVMNYAGKLQKTGGIDLTTANMNLQTQNVGEGIKFHMDSAMLQQLQNAPGFVPVIISIQPMRDLRQFLGVQDHSPATAVSV
jgi:hypothetical protein